ncbi:MAG: cytochrome c biogenesis protein CcsA [Gammaproteobacteria bacterium]|nr:cytochrome c biogenesis protein CcsA [Gammaproteobacteria bacterium]
MFQITIPICYLAAGWLSGVQARSAKFDTPSRYSIPALTVGGLGIVLHAWLLATSIASDGGLELGITNVLSVTAWLIAIIALLAALRGRLRGLSAFLLPCAAVGAAVTGFGPQPDPTSTTRWELDAHILLSVTAYSLFSIAAALAVLMALQQRRLHAGRPPGWVSMLPPVEAMERVLFTTLGVGFGLLSLALFSGLVFLDNWLAQHLVHKTVLSLVAWLVFAVLLLGRWRFGWRGSKAIWLTLGGFGFLALAYFGSKLVLEAILGEQWG